MLDVTSHVLASIFARDMVLKMGYTTSMDMVKLTKVSVHTTSKYVAADPKYVSVHALALQLMTGQTPYVTRAKQSIATWKLKKGMVLGCAVTLRRAPMTHCLTQWLMVLLPRFKDRVSLPVPSTHHTVHVSMTQPLFHPSAEHLVELFEPIDGCVMDVHTNATSHIETLLLCTAIGLPVHSVDTRVDAQPPTHAPS